MYTFFFSILVPSVKETKITLSFLDNVYSIFDVESIIYTYHFLTVFKVVYTLHLPLLKFVVVLFGTIRVSPFETEDFLITGYIHVQKSKFLFYILPTFTHV